MTDDVRKVARDYFNDRNGAKAGKATFYENGVVRTTFYGVAAYAHFGWRVAVSYDGLAMVVGAPGDNSDDLGLGVGSVMVYSRTTRRR